MHEKNSPKIQQVRHLETPLGATTPCHAFLVSCFQEHHFNRRSRYRNSTYLELLRIPLGNYRPMPCICIKIFSRATFASHSAFILHRLEVIKFQRLTILKISLEQCNIFGIMADSPGATAPCVEFYLYPTVSTALIHLVKPGLNKWDYIEFGVRSNWVILWYMVTIRCIVTYKIFINKQVNHINVNNKAGTVYRPILQYSSI